MGMKPPISLDVFKDARQLAIYLGQTQITPSDDSVGTDQIAGGDSAADDTFYVKRNGSLRFGHIGDGDIPSGIARDTEVTAGDAAVTVAFQTADVAVTAAFTAADAAHVAAPDPHTGYVLESTILNGSATYDPASLLTLTGATTTVTVTGAVLGDFALASFSLDLQGVTVSAYVSTADTVSVRFQNDTAGTVDLSSGTLRARVWKQ